MAVFIELTTEPFESVFRQKAVSQQGAGGGSRSSRAGKTTARRPVRGIEIKDDTYAYIKVVMANGQEIPVMDSSSSTGTSSGGYTNFILQSVSEQRAEKHQIVETFGDNYIFFFGESPRFLDCQAVLVSTHDFNWRAEWWYNYDNYWRGTKLVERSARCYMAWDDIVVEGYMVTSAASEMSDQPYSIQLQFRFFVTNYQNVNLYNVEQYPVRQSVDAPDGVSLTQADAFSRLQAYYLGGSNASRAQDAVPQGQSTILNTLPSSPGNASTISNQIRQLPPSAVTDPSVWNALSDNGVSDPSSMSNVGGSAGALRGLIHDNTDEYINGSDGYSAARPYMQTDTDEANEGMSRLNEAVQQQQELPYDLAYGTVNTLSTLGIDADNEVIMRNLGLSPNFSQAYVASVGAFVRASSSQGFGSGVGVGANTSFGGTSGLNVSFSPLSNASYGVAAGAGIGVSAMAGYYANSTLNQSVQSLSPYYQYKDPLGAVYGNNAASTDSFNADAYKYVEGRGNPHYGYRSPYGGAGYGQAGFGDFGGSGFGSGNSSTGDPGYRNPDTVSVSGLVQAVRPQYDMTALTPGPSYGMTAVGGASVSVGGASTGFALTSLDGSFAPWVEEAANAEEPLDGQPAVGPGFSGSYQPDVGYASQQQILRPAFVPYVGTPPSAVVPSNVITSFGFV